MASPMEIAMKEMGALIAAAASPQSAIDALKTDVTQRGINVMSAPYNAVGDGVANDTAAFQAVEAATGKIVLLPEGTYVVNGLTLTKRYIGPGKIKLNGVLQGNIYVNIGALPTQGNYNRFFDGDQTRMIAEHFTIENIPARNTDMDSQYFNWELIPHLLVLDNYTGSSGYNTTVDADSASGQKVLNVQDTTPFAVGQQVLIAEFTSSREVCTIASIQAGVSLTMASNLLFAHLGAERSSVALGGRTMHSGYSTQVQHHGLGDAYGHVYRVLVDSQPQASQYHYFQTATGGLLGGDMFGMSDGVYLTGFENQISDTTDSAGSKDVAAAGFVTTYTRNKDTGGRGVKWFGTYQDSVGTKYMETAHAVRGKFRSALDTVNLVADPDKAAIRMAIDQRIYFDCSSTPDVGGYSLWGNVIGTMWLGYDTPAGGLKIANGGNTIRLTSVDTYFSGNVRPNADLYMLRNSKHYLDSGSSDTYITCDGTNVKIIKAGVQVASW